MYQLLVITLTEKATWQLHISHERLALTGPGLLANFHKNLVINLDPGKNDSYQSLLHIGLCSIKIVVG